MLNMFLTAFYFLPDNLILHAAQQTAQKTKSLISFLFLLQSKKKTDDKSLSSVFKTAQTAVNELNKNDINIQTFSEFSALQFKSFQIADCITDENQYRICNNFWIKIIS